MHFGCALKGQFVYDASYFSGPITITGLTFFNSLVDSPDTFDPATYTFSLSTTTAAIGSLDSTFANNRGGDFQLFATVPIAGGAIPGVFTFFGTPFNYDPANGNLLLEVLKPDSGDTFSGFTDYNTGGGFLASRVWSQNLSGAGSANANYAPVIQLESAIPEPATLSFVGLSLLGLVAWRVRKA